MPRHFRAMKESEPGLPDTGASARALGVRPGIDVPVRDLSAMVRAGQGGLSVSPDDPRRLPAHRRPPEFGGTGRDGIWVITDAELAPDLEYRPDPDNPDRGLIEPARPMTLADFQEALTRTRPLWRRAGAVSVAEEQDGL